jgi:ferredoxin
MDCTGCQLCVAVCPDSALEAQPLQAVLAVEDTHWSFAKALPERTGILDRASVKASAHRP